MKPEKTRAQLAKEYGVTRKTFYNWLKREGLHLRNRSAGPEELELIYEHFGRPRAA